MPLLSCPPTRSEALISWTEACCCREDDIEDIHKVTLLCCQPCHSEWHPLHEQLWHSIHGH